jgi:hypothetical protein
MVLLEIGYAHSAHRPTWPRWPSPLGFFGPRLRQGSRAPWLSAAAEIPTSRRALGWGTGARGTASHGELNLSDRGGGNLPEVAGRGGT